MPLRKWNTRAPGISFAPPSAARSLLRIRGAIWLEQQHGRGVNNSTGQAMNSDSRPMQHMLAAAAILGLGFAAGAVLVWAHDAGHLIPLYQKLGLHFAHQQPEERPDTGPAAHTGHEGHGGMSMPKAAPGEPSKIP